MEKRRLVGVVAGAHVFVIGGLLLSQGCGTTRAPLPPADDFVMPPSVEEEDMALPVAVPPVYRPAPMPPIEVPVVTVPEVKPVVVTPPTETTTYVVAKGDALSVIAKRYDVSLQEVMRLNNITDANKIRIGQRLKLPGVIDLDQPRAQEPRRQRPATSAPAIAGGTRYVIQAGDSLSVIAQRHGVSVQDLQRVNNITDVHRIQVGQELAIPAGGRRPAAAAAPVQPVAAPTPAPVVRPVAPVVEERVTSDRDVSAAGSLPPAPAPRAGGATYVVEIGDDLLSVASEFNVSIAALREANNLDSDILVPGRTLVIPETN